jgi:signal transduction histidine kinase
MKRLLPSLSPRSLRGRIFLSLAAALVFFLSATLALYTFDHRDLEVLARARTVAGQAMVVYRALIKTDPAARSAVLRSLELPTGVRAALLPAPPADLGPAPLGIARLVQSNFLLTPLPPHLRPRDAVVLGTWDAPAMEIGLAFPDTGWLAVTVPVPAFMLWRSWFYFSLFLALLGLGLGLALLLAHSLTAPIRTFALAAEKLGRDVNAPPLPESGPREIAAAAAAFNRMAERIRRFVEDRTFVLTAIGHDLRTPLTRLKLRAEFLEDDEMRAKILADLDEMEAMLSATLALGRDVSTSEKAAPLDLVSLLQTVLDEAGDTAAEPVPLSFAGPERLHVTARPQALKRAFANLIGNAVKYGRAAHLSLHPPSDEGGERMVTIDIDDEGPGLPPEVLERVFEPFFRVEESRNRETGGMGLGLTIARNILRAHGGDVVLLNRAEGGLRARVYLPA